MKNKGITLVSLVVTIIVLILLAGISLNLTLGDNGILTMAKKAKENTELAKIEEEKILNELYTQIEVDGGLSEGLDYDAILKLYEFKKVIADAIEEAGGVRPEDTADAISFGESIKGIVTEVTKETTITEDKMLKDYTAYKDGKLIIGTMSNNGELNNNLNCGQSYTIPVGYTSGGKITANSLASQTQATATASQILSGQTAWVNGTKITGNMLNRGAVSQTLNAGGSYTIPAGYHNGSGRITAASRQISNGGGIQWYDELSSTIPQNNGISQKSINVDKDRYAIVTVNLRHSTYDNDNVSVSCSGMNIIASTSSGGYYSKWAGTFGQAYVFFGYTTSTQLVLSSNKAYRWSGSINYINIT